MNSEFDQIMADADVDLFKTFGGLRMVENLQGQQSQLYVDFNTDFQQVVDGMINYLGPVISILNPPAQNMSGWKAHMHGGVYTLRERIDSDQSVARYAVTKS